MGDGLKISKDKRHRSSSSLSGATVEVTRSERKLEIRPSIPEAEDEFALAEARCDDLQEKIDLVKVLKRKQKFKKRSMTKVSEQLPVLENVPFISVRAQPKKTNTGLNAIRSHVSSKHKGRAPVLVTEVSQQAARLRRLEIPPNPTRGYLDPTMVEQHRMIGQVRGYNQTFKNPQRREQKAKFPAPTRDQRVYDRTRPRRTRADGDCAPNVLISNEGPMEVACGEDDIIAEFSDNDIFEQLPDEYATANMKKPVENRRTMKSPISRRRPSLRNNQVKEVPLQSQLEDQSVVELFKNLGSSMAEGRRQNIQPAAFVADKKNRRVRPTQRYEQQVPGPLHEDSSEIKVQEPQRRPRRVKYRSRQYELPTIASQMKQAGMRYYYGNSNHTNIPFVVSKSTAPSHNIGVNIQQVLNGLKIQQPLSGIPLTIAHHMGLGHIETHGSTSATAGNFDQHVSLDNREINAIKVGQRLLRLPSYKYMSYNRLLTLYREGDGMVPRFLKAISRPHYFYTSMYNLATNFEDLDGATSKGRGGNHDAKESLAEYASLYREYEHIDKCIRDGNNEPELERRKEELTRELATREEHIRKVVQEYRTSADVDQPILRASASTTEDNYRHSTFKLNMGSAQQ